VEDFDRCWRGAHFYRPPHQLIGHAVEAAIELNVIVDSGARLTRLGGEGVWSGGLRRPRGGAIRPERKTFSPPNTPESPLNLHPSQYPRLLPLANFSPATTVSFYSALDTRLKNAC
jgi:hypothetical protein